MGRGITRAATALAVVAWVGCRVASGGLGVGAGPSDAGPRADGSTTDADARDAAPLDGCSPTVELCDGLDNDCNPDTPDGADQEGFGTPCDGDDEDACRDGRLVCAIAALVCDDDAMSRREICNGVDDDCDGTVDETDPATALLFYEDADGDGFGNVAVMALSCTAPEGFVDNADDCDDTAPTVFPGAAELCNGVDDDCNGVLDDSDDCGCSAEVRDGHTYLFCIRELEWAQASAECRTVEGFELVTIDDGGEDGWLRDRVRHHAGTEWWMGMHDAGHEGRWEWESGVGVGYVNWATGQPDDGGDGWFAEDEDCGEINWEGGRWNDTQCDKHNPFVCERPDTT